MGKRVPVLRFLGCIILSCTYLARHVWASALIVVIVNYHLHIKSSVHV